MQRLRRRCRVLAAVGVLLGTLAGSALASPPHQRRVARQRVRHTVRTALRAKQLTPAGLAALGQSFEALPGRASRSGRAALKLYYSKQVSMSGELRQQLGKLLRGHGYPVHHAKSIDGARRGNIREVDRTFARLSARAGKTGSKITIAVDDGGFDTGHAALAGKLWRNPSPTMGDVHGYEFQKKTGNLKQVSSFMPGIDEGPIGHGTHVLGVATKGTQRIKAIGLAHNNSDAFLVKSLRYGIAKGARVINISRSIIGEALVAEVVKLIKAHPDVLFTVSAGNSGQQVKAEHVPRYLPANVLDNLVAVAADVKGRPLAERNSKSNYGTSITIAAAAKHYSGSFGMIGEKDRGYVHAGATSQAAPLVANVAAKAMLLAPQLSARQVKRLVAITARPNANWKGKVATDGVLDPKKALTLAALAGLVHGGMSPSAAASKLRLRRATGEQLAGLLSQLGER